uniref:Uncharacterized protein n=1 Tax=Vespula pensylvanica TaxID=30213 RepID=A0A834PGK6_VESPE|nr:hypothetical protein H0235_001725 [Vespula pensylvanica]
MVVTSDWKGLEMRSVTGSFVVADTIKTDGFTRLNFYINPSSSTPTAASAAAAAAAPATAQCPYSSVCYVGARRNSWSIRNSWMALVGWLGFALVGLDVAPA